MVLRLHKPSWDPAKLCSYKSWTSGNHFGHQTGMQFIATLLPVNDKQLRGRCPFILSLWASSVKLWMCSERSPQHVTNDSVCTLETWISQFDFLWMNAMNYNSLEIQIKAACYSRLQVIRSQVKKMNTWIFLSCHSV